MSTISLGGRLTSGKLTLAVIALFFVLAAVLRFDFIFTATNQISHDTVHYDIMVRQLLEKGIYGYKSETSNAQIPPGYPLFMAAVYKLFDYPHRNPYSIIRCIQAGMSLLTMFLAVRISDELGGRMASLVTAAAMAVYPAFIWANGAILTEPLAAMLLMVYLYVQLSALNKRTVRVAILAGAALGLVMLTRSEFAVLLIGAYAFQWFVTRNAKESARLFLAAALGTALVLSPWIMRNVVTLHKPIIASTQVNPFASGTYPNKNYDDGLVDRHGKTQMQVAKERLKIGFTEHTWTFVKWYTEGKLRAIYSRMFFGANHSPLYPVIPYGRLFHITIVLGGLLSSLLIMLRNRRSPAGLIVVLFTVITVTRLAFIPEYRYNFTAMPLLIMLAALPAAAFAAKLSRYSRYLNKPAIEEERSNAAP